MQKVALQVLSVQCQLPKFEVLLTYAYAHCGFCGFQRRKCVAYTADTADPRSYMVQFVPLTSHDHGFKEPWRFRNVPFAFFHNSFLYVYVDIAMSFHACYM